MPQPSPSQPIPPPEEVAAALKRHFGFESFRTPQDEVIGAILEGRDVLAIMPTGRGKSLCYQLPALLLPGVTLVVSPLIALMKDQVDALTRRGIRAGMINSTQSWDEQREILGLLRASQLKLVYVAPERFRARSFVEALAPCKLSLFAVDEAHCLSQWGHDFRPDYLRLSQALEPLGRPRVAAFTATATPEVRDDIVHHLGLRSPKVTVSGFARPNLAFSVHPVDSTEAKRKRLRELIREHGTGIIYCATRKTVEQVSAFLRADGLAHVTYHGGIDDPARTEAQNRFMDGSLHLAVATNAFGMGIDRADIRFVCHYEMPGSVEALYQESGRAGRDGAPAVCQMLFTFADKRVQEFFLEGANPTRATVMEVYDRLRAWADGSHEVRLSVDEMVNRLPGKINPMAVNTALSLLVRARMVERFDIAGQRIRGTRLLQPDVPATKLPLEEASLREKRARDEKKLRAVIQYAYANCCRQQWILRYFGETDQTDCGRCDRCADGRFPNAARALLPAELTLVRKALSGVARMSDRVGPDEWKPRFGRRRITQCLLGSRSEGIVGSGLDKLSTYGLLRECGRSFVNALFDSLERAGLVHTEGDEYPVLTLTPEGSRVMRGANPPHLEFPPEASLGRSRPPRGSHQGSGIPPPQAVTEDPETASDPATRADEEKLFLRLAQYRQILASTRNLPPYRILSNASLRGLASLQPEDSLEAQEIPGIGPAKASTVLPGFLRIIAEWKQQS